MKKTLFFTALFLSTFFQADAQCANNNNIVSFSYGGVNYEIIKENKTWLAASQCAVSRGGFLVEINSQGEQDAVFSAMNTAGITASNTVAPDGGGASYLWIGGNDIQTEGTWIWDGDNTGVFAQFWQGTSAGSAVGGLFSNWGNEPDNYNNQDALGIALTDWPFGIAGQWNDIDASNSIYYVIEYPATSGLNENSNLDIRVYPNPALNELKIDLSTQEIEVKEIHLFNYSGKEIDIYFPQNELFELNVSSLPKGIYSLIFIDGNERNFNYSFVKE